MFVRRSMPQGGYSNSENAAHDVRNTSIDSQDLVGTQDQLNSPRLAALQGQQRNG